MSCRAFWAIKSYSMIMNFDEKTDIITDRTCDQLKRVDENLATKFAVVKLATKSWRTATIGQYIPAGRSWRGSQVWKRGSRPCLVRRDSAQQRFQKFRLKPRQDHRHTIMDGSHHRVQVGDDNGEGFNDLGEVGAGAWIRSQLSWAMSPC